MAILNRPAPTRLVEVTGRLRFKKFAPIPGAGRGWILTDLPRPAPTIFTKMPLGFLFQTHTHTHTHIYIYISILSLQSSLHPPLSLSSHHSLPQAIASHHVSHHADITPPATTPISHRQPPHAAASTSRRCHLSLSLPHADSSLTKSEYFFSPIWLWASVSLIDYSFSNTHLI